MNNQQIQKMLGIDAGAAEATAETLECLGFNVETAVKAIKCGMEAGSVSRADDGKWLAMDMGLYRWVLEQDTSARVAHITKLIWDDESPSPAANETDGATGRGAVVVVNKSGEQLQKMQWEETAVNGGGVG